MAADPITGQRIDAGRAGAALSSWLSVVLDDRGPFRMIRLSGGNSNITALVTSGPRRWILRRPPERTLSPTAHNLAREYRVLTALAEQEVPTPRPIAYCADPSVVPVPCLLMEAADGDPLTDAWPMGWVAGDQAIRAVGLAAVDALAAVHAIDWQRAGLSDFGHPDGYLRRQVARWRAQYERNQVRDLPLFDRLGSWLDRHRPAPGQPALIHGDFHLDNCLFVEEPVIRVSAVIDWELSTIGDPLVDLGLLLGFWGPDRGEPYAMPQIQAISRRAGAPSRQELADRYAAATGRSVSDLGFYMTLAFFKLAAIVEGAYAQHVRGQLDSDYARGLRDDVPNLLRAAEHFSGL